MPRVRRDRERVLQVPGQEHAQRAVRGVDTDPAGLRSTRMDERGNERAALELLRAAGVHPSRGLERLQHGARLHVVAVKSREIVYPERTPVARERRMVRAKRDEARLGAPIE